MNSKTSSITIAPAKSVIKSNCATDDLHEKSFLEVMDSIPGGDNIEFDLSKLNFTFKPLEFD